MSLHVRLCATHLKKAASDWMDHNDSSQGAAIAFYTVLSLAPLLVVVVAVAGFFFGQEAVRGQVFWQVRNLIGDQAASTVESLLKAAYHPATGIAASIIGFLILLMGASGVFIQLRQTLNYIWGVDPNVDCGFGGILRSRLFSFAMVIGIGFLLVVSLALSAIISAMGSYASQLIFIPAPMLLAVNFVVTFVVTSFLFALIYKVVPETKIEWEDVATGAIFTALFFDIGKVAIGLYLGKASVGSAYGAAGSLVVLLVWVYYSSQIFLYGAEFTHVNATSEDKVTAPPTRAPAHPALRPRHP
jgi:membrane protein